MQVNDQHPRPRARRRQLRRLAVVVLAVAALGSANAAIASAADISDVENAQVKLINDYRATQGAPPLAIDQTLSNVADWMGADMPAFNYFGHEDHLGRDPFARLTAFNYPSDTWRGENLAAGNEDAQATFDQWRNSPGHNANMLNANYHFVGISRVDAPDSTYKFYWVTEFGSRASNDSSTPSGRSGSTTPTGSTGGGGSTTNGGTAGGSTPAATATAARARRARVLARARACRRLRHASRAYRRGNCSYWLRAARRYH